MDWPSWVLIDDQGENQTRVLRTSEITEQMWFPCEVYGRTAKCRSCATQGPDHPVGESPSDIISNTNSPVLVQMKWNISKSMRKTVVSFDTTFDESSCVDGWTNQSQELRLLRWISAVSPYTTATAASGATVSVFSSVQNDVAFPVFAMRSKTTSGLTLPLIVTFCSSRLMS